MGAFGNRLKRGLIPIAVLVAVLLIPGPTWAALMTTRASVDTGGGDPNSDSFSPSISATGRYVAFSSLASDLVPGDGNSFRDVFVRDLVAGTTTRASVDTGGGAPNGDSFVPSISATGRYVAFYSYASDLVPGDGNGFIDVFVRGSLIAS